MNIAKISIKAPVFITMIMAVLIVVGVIGYTRLPVDLLPNFETPTIFVSVNYPGAGPLEIERQISEPLEAALVSLNGVRNVRSQSRENNSQVVVEFAPETSPQQAANDVRERVAQTVPRLPTGVSAPSVQRFDPSSSPIFNFAVTDPSGKMKSADLRRLVTEQIEPRLERLDGVGDVTVGGGQDRQIQVNLNLDSLRSYRISPAQVTAALRAENTSVPGGSITQEGQDMLLRTPGEFKTLDDIANVAIASTRGAPVLIKNIGTVSDSTTEVTSYNRLNGTESVSVQVRKQSGTNTVAVAGAVRDEIARMGRDPVLRSLKIVVNQDQSEFIRKSIDDSISDLELGAIFAGLVVFFFFRKREKTLLTVMSLVGIALAMYLLLNSFGVPQIIINGVLFLVLLVFFAFTARNTLVTIAGLPVIMIATFAIMNALNLSVNMMTLLALSIAVGLVIDDAIVVRENIFRHIELGEEPKVAAENGTNEVALSVTAMTLSVVSVFLPVAYATGQIGRYLREFGFAVAGAVLISLFEAFTLAPMLSAYFSERRKQDATRPHAAHGEDNLGWLDDKYRATLKWMLEQKLWAGIASIIVTSVVIVMIWYFGSTAQLSFIPRIDNGLFSVSLQLPPGTTLEITNAKAKLIETALLSIPEVQAVFANVGGGSAERANFTVKLKDIKFLKSIEEPVRAKLAGMGVSYNFQGAFGGGGNNRPIQMNLLSSGSPEELAKISEDVFKAFSTIPGATDLVLSNDPGQPELGITVDRARASRLGLNVSTLGSTVRSLVQGDTATRYRDPGREADIVVRLRPQDRDRIEDIQSLPINLPSGQVIPLSDVATITKNSTPSVIDRLNRQTRINIGLNAVGVSQQDMANAMRAKIQQLKLPPTVTPQVAGLVQQTQDSFNILMSAFGLSLLFMYMVLASQFNSFTQPFVLMLALPLALIGALVALFLAKLGVDMIALIGVILLMGLVVKNSILLVDFTNRLRAEGMMRDQALLVAGPIRLRPILMTTLSLILGMFPVALGLGAGGGFRSPMAIAVIGGLVTSTLLTLFIVPLAYVLLDIVLIRLRQVAVPIIARVADKSGSVVGGWLAPVANVIATRANDYTSAIKTRVGATHPPSDTPAAGAAEAED